MNVVHPVDSSPIGGAVAPRRVIRAAQGTPTTQGSVALRLIQLVFSAAALCIMATSIEFSKVTSFRCLAAATGLQAVWSLLVGLLDIHALSAGYYLHTVRVLTLFVIGDWVIFTLAIAAVGGSGGLILHMWHDRSDCPQDHCSQFGIATAMSLIAWMASIPSVASNVSVLASL